MEESKNPFEAFGGQEVVDTDKDPFSAFGGVEVKKKVSGSAPKSGLPSSDSGLNLSPSSLTNLSSQTELSPVTDPKLRQSIIQQQNTPDVPDTGAQRLLDKLSPSERANMLAFNKIASAKPKDELTAPTAEERAHQDFMQTNTGKALGAVAYLGSKATKGTLQVLKGAAHLAGGLSALPGGEATTDHAFNMLDKASDYGLTKSDIANQESGKSGKALSALGMAAEFAPAVATGEALNAPKSLMYLQGVGQGKELADNLENNGTKLNPIAKEALIQGTGAVNLLLTDIFKGAKVSSSLQDKVTTGIAADALKESAGKDISVDSFKELLQKKAQDFAGKFERAPVEILKHYNETAKTFTKLNVGNFALHKAVDEVNDKPVFNETLGDLAGNEQKALTQDAPIFSAVPAVGELTKLLPNSGYRNEVVDAVMKDPSPENIDQIKDKIYNHGFDDSNPNKWSPEEMDATFQHVDKIADAARALPRDISENKRDKAVGLVLDRNELQDRLKSLQEAKKNLDPSIQDIPTAKEQYLTDKIEQANDKLRDIVKGSRTTYSKERDDKGQETGKFLKKTDDAVEEITPTRYDLERTERDARESNHMPVERHPELTTEQQQKLPSAEDVMAKNDEIDKKISEFQSKFPDHHIDPLEDLPEHVVRTFDRVDNDLPTDPVAVNEASEWLYKKYKELSKLKESDTRTLTIPQIDAMQEQLGEDITTLENHKLKYHGAEEKTEVQPKAPLAEQPISPTGPTGENSETRNATIGTKESTTRQLNEQTTETPETELPVQAEPEQQVEAASNSQPVSETPDGEPDKEISPVRQKAIDAVTHGIITPGDENGRFDLGMSKAERDKAMSDISKGNYDTAPAKRLLDKIEEFEKNDDYPIIEGKGGQSVRRRGATAAEIQQHIDDAKSFELAKEQDSEANNKALADLGFTHEDFENYENRTRELREGRSGNPDNRGALESPAKNVQRAKNDNAAGEAQNKRSAPVQTEPTRSETKLGDPLRSFATKVREGKINRLGGFKASTGFDGVWDASLEVVAKTLEGGAKVADAIEAGLKHVKGTDWYKSLSDKENFDKQYRNHLKSEYDEHEKTAPIKNETSNERAEAAGVKIEDTRNGKRGADIVDSDAAKSISEGYDTPDLINRILNEKHQASDTEVAILSKYADAKEREIAQHDKELSESGATMSKGDFNALLAKKEQAQSDFQDALQAARKTGTETARALAARKNSFNQEYSLANMVARKREAMGGEKLSKEQFDEINNRFSELEQARKDFEAKVAKLEAENAKLRATQTVKQTAAERLKRKSVKIEGIESKKKQLVDDWRAELKKIRTSTSAVAVPYARELAATAPFVAKYLRYLAEEGVVEVKDVVDRIHETFKEDLPDLTKRDVTDILAGVYDEKKPTRTKITSDIQSLKTQARLLNEIEDLENGIKKVVPGSKTANEKNEAVERLRSRLSELNSQDEPTPEEKDLGAYKRRIEANISKLQERLNNEDYEKPENKPELKLDNEALELRRKYDKLKSNFDLEVAKDQLRQRTGAQKRWDDFLNIATLPRALKASLDFSAVLRQGLFASVGHPAQAVTAFKEMFGQTFSEKRYENWLSDIKHSEFYDLMQKSDLYISDKNDPKLLAREEEFTSNLADKIPVLGKVIAASERAYTGYLNVLRTGVFVDGAQSLLKKGYDFESNPEQFKALAKVVNVLTGRGDIPEFLGGKQPKVLSNLLFSPRFMASRIQTLYLWADPRLPKEAKIMAAKDIGSTLALGGSLLALASLSGYKVVTDPRSSQFLKIQDKQEKGTTYYDILGGLPQYVRFLSQQVSGKKVPASGHGVIDLTTGKYGKPTRLSEAGNFARGKVSPLVGIGFNLLEGKDVVGQSYHLWPDVPKELIPLPFTDVQEAYKIGGIDNALKTFLPSQFGISVSSYDPSAKKKK